MRDVVFHRGPNSSHVMVIGERPGREEASRGYPFAGASGIEQDVYVRKHSHDNTDTKRWWVGNVVPTYKDGNPDPTKAEIAEWTPALESCVRQCQPKLILAVGRFAARWFLGNRASMRMCHGIPHEGGAFDDNIAYRACGAVVVPVYHPAWGMRDLGNRAICDWDYKKAMDIRRQITKDYHMDFDGTNESLPCDTWEGEEVYEDIRGVELDDQFDPAANSLILSVDTEGSTRHPWSLQVSWLAGSGFTLRCSDDDFLAGMASLQRMVDSEHTVLLHNALFDMPMCKAMGLDLSRAKIIDTMYMAYLLRHEPQGLKALAWRWCGMRMSTYWEVIGKYVIDRQLNFLERASKLSMPKCPAISYYENDGSEKSYTPQAANRKASRIVEKLSAGGFDEGGKTKERNMWIDCPWYWTDHTPLYKAWYNTQGTYDKAQGQLAAVAEVERKLGVRMPRGSIADAPLNKAVVYASRDADASLRVFHAMRPELEQRGLM